jgi:hypothetical protein
VDLVANQLEAHHLAVPGDHGINICYGYCNVVDDPAVGRLEDLCKRFLLTWLEGGPENLPLVPLRWESKYRLRMQ